MDDSFGEKFESSSNFTVHVSRSLESEDIEQEVLEGIAITGFSFKFPQEADSSQGFWEMLINRRCAATGFPKDRMNMSTFYHPNAARYDAFPVAGGHFVKEDLGAFDAPFFSITPVEAAAMDPHQRGLLETTYRALENSGIPIESIAGTAVSVYTASFADGYRARLFRDTEAPLPKYCVVGTEPSSLANRISWFFNLHGPSANVDSACSGSLTALDIACLTLRNGDANMSIVTGGNTILDPANIISLCKMNLLSQAGRCYSFDHRASGYAKGEGIGVIVLKRLSDAIRDRDPIRAVIRATGCNQDGHTPGMTQPSPLLQERLIRDTYQKAGLSMKTTRFFEAHGTGTAIGDPTEASAIGAAFAGQRESSEPLYIGAVKSNIGHLEGGSGIAAVIKTILVLETGVIPPNTNFERCNAKIDTKGLNIKFPLEATPWPTAGLRRASINSFGFGGTNAHVIIDDAYNFLRSRGVNGIHHTRKIPPSTAEVRDLGLASDYLGLCSHAGPGKSITHATSMKDSYSNGEITKEAVSDGSSVTDRNGTNGMVDGQLSQETIHTDIHKSHPGLLILSAADRKGIERLAVAYSDHFQKVARKVHISKSYISDLAYTLSARRSALAWRSFSVCQNYPNLLNFETHVSKAMQPLAKPSLGLIYTGQGAQWPRMGYELIAYPVFMKSLLAAEAYLYSLGCPWSLTEELLKDKHHSNIDQADKSQSLCIALQVALTDLLRSSGIEAVTVVGHSSGEIAAAYSIGAISDRSAWKIAYYRGILTSRLAASREYRGAMMAVALSEAEVRPHIDELSERLGESRVSIGCINSPKNVTLSGNESQIDALKDSLDQAKVFTRKLRVDVAYHSSQMQLIASEYSTLLGELESGITRSKPPVMISSLTGRNVSPEELREPQYWASNMTSPVKFSQALSVVCARPRKRIGQKLGKFQQEIVINDLMEVGPHSALQGPIREVLKSLSRDDEIEYSSVLSRNTSALEHFLHKAGRLYCRGYTLKISQINEPLSHSRPSTLIHLPEYPFNHSQRYWHETRLDKSYRMRTHARHELLGTPSLDWNPLDARWRNFIRASELPWIVDHKVNGAIVYPGAGMLVMAIEAMLQLADSSRSIRGFSLRNISFHYSLAIPVASDGVETQFSLRPLRNGASQTISWHEFMLCVYENEQWHENCRGQVQIAYDGDGSEITRSKAMAKERMAQQQTLDQAVRNCPNSVSSTMLYQYLKKNGLEYGPSFQRLENIYYSDCDEGHAEVTLFYDPEDPYHDWASPHVIHPATLDAIAHSIFVGLSRGGTLQEPTRVPTKVAKIWVSRRGLSYPASCIVKVHAKSVRKSVRVTESCVLALDSSNGQTLVAIEKMETTAVADTNNVSQSSKEEQFYFNTDCKPDLSLLSASQVTKYCSGSTPETDLETEKFFLDLMHLTLIFISETLAQLENTSTSSFPSHIQKYIEWMKFQLHQYHRGDLPNSSSEWAETFQDAAVKESLCFDVESFSSQGRLFVETGRNLHNIITGKVDVHELLFQGSLASDFYRDILHNTSVAKSLTTYLDAYAHKIPGMKVLELGAGTGSATALALQTLFNHGDSERGTPRFGQYDFTDISNSFFEAAKENFPGEAQHLNFKVLDIEGDPEAQGFEAWTYDLLIAFGVIHITKNLEMAVQNARKLLKPGGKLIMCEITRPELLRSSFAFGLFSGWWLSTEKYRSWGPLVSEAKWDEVLSRNGFSGAEIILRDYQNEVCHELSLIVSTAVDPAPAVRPWAKTLIIADQRSGDQAVVARRLQSQLNIKGYEDAMIASLEDLPINLLRGSCCICLVDLDKPFLLDLNAETFTRIQAMLSSARKLIWVSGGGGAANKDPSFGMIDGLARVLRNENANLMFVTVALDPGSQDLTLKIDHIMSVLQSMVLDQRSIYEEEYVERNGMLEIRRLVEAKHLKDSINASQSLQQNLIQPFGQVANLELEIKTLGLLDTFQFIEDRSKDTPLRPNEVEVQVKAAGLNYTDCLSVLGRLNRTWLGSECAGVVTRVGEQSFFNPGDRVAGCSPRLCKTSARLPTSCVWKIPDGWTFDIAASLPTAFTLAYYALYEKAQLKSGDLVLIHCGAGGLGQAAIKIAMHFGANVYTTVGSQEKKDLVLDLFGLPEENVFGHGRGFVSNVKRLTKGRGVDIVLNTLAGEQGEESLECVAPYGTFLGLAVSESNQNTIPLSSTSNVSVVTIDFASLISERPDLVQRSFKEAMALLSEGSIDPPSPIHIYSVSDVEDAFRALASGKQAGKTVISFGQDDLVKTVLGAQKYYHLDPDSSYIISGGFGGVGCLIAQWMVSRGARNLILLSRSGAQRKEAVELLNSLKTQDVRVEAPHCDVTDYETVKSVLDDCATRLPPIKGCVHGAMVMEDLTFESMTHAAWTRVVRPKVQGTQNLHALLPPALDFFIMLSSMSGIYGNSSQANYAAGNTYQDALAHYRVARGEKAVALNLGPISDTGLVAQNEDIQKRMSAGGMFTMLSSDDVCAQLEYYCNPHLPLPSALKCQTLSGINIPAHIRAQGFDEPDWMHRSLFAHFHQIKGSEAGIALENGASAQAIDMPSAMASAALDVDAGMLVTEALMKKLSRILALPLEDIDVHQPIHALGVDSLVAVDIRNWCAKEAKADVAIFDIMGETSLEGLGLLLARKSLYRQGKVVE